MDSANCCFSQAGLWTAELLSGRHGSVPFRCRGSEPGWGGYSLRLGPPSLPDPGAPGPELHVAG